MGLHIEEINTFLDSWEKSDDNNKEVFRQLLSLLQGFEKCVIEFHQRPGITYSLRGTYEREQGAQLFVMVDVIEDSPRWLSVCFYGKMITDPEEKGAFVPGGLLGEDAVCFDIDTYDEKEISYVGSRIEEAYKASIDS